MVFDLGLGAMLGELMLRKPTDDCWAIGTTWRTKRGDRPWTLTGHRSDGCVRLEGGERAIFRTRKSLLRYYEWDKEAGICANAEFIAWHEIPKASGETIRFLRAIT